MKREEKILLWSNNLWSFGEGMFGPLFAVFAERVGGSVLQITWAWAIYLGITGLLTIVVGLYSDKIWQRCGREWLSVAGYSLNALFTFGYLFVTNTAGLFVVQAGLGVALALSNPTWSALYDRYAPREVAKGFSWGLMSGEERLVLGIAILLGGFIVSHFSFETLFVTMGCIQIISTLYQARLLFDGRGNYRLRRR